MFVAVSSYGDKVSADTAVLLGGDYFCPKCGAPVNLRAGLVKVEHFAHAAKASCDYAGESLLHVLMKSQIYQNLKTAIGQKVRLIELEKPLGPVRPDVFIEGNKVSVAIEVQASVLTPRQILDRTAKYHSLGIFVLWVIPYEEHRITKTYAKVTNQLYQSIRIKEYERIIMQMYFKTLVLWNINRDPTMGFRVLQLGDTYTDGVEFYDRDMGEHRSFSPKKLKTMKSIEAVRDSIQLSEFYPKKVAGFKMPMANYNLPPRSIMLYNWHRKINR